MENQEIIDFIKQSRKQGALDDEIRASLKSVGWVQESIEASFAFLDKQVNSSTVIATPQVPEVPGNSVENKAPIPSGPVSVKPPASERQVNSLTPKMIVPDPVTMSPISQNLSQGQNTASQASVANIQPQSPALANEFSKKPNYKKITLGIFLSLLGLVIVSGLIIFYIIVAQGKTVFGYNLMDEAWKNFVFSKADLLSEQNIKFGYKDSGEYKFIPSDFLKAIFPDIISQKEMQQLDDGYSFLIKNPTFESDLSVYSDLRNIKDKRLDGSLGLVLGNNDKYYSTKVDTKLLEEVGYIRYNTNDTLRSFLSSYDKSISDSIEDSQNLWFKFLKKNLNQNNTALDIISDETNEKISKIIGKNRVFEIKSFLVPQKINGRWTLRYELSLNKARVKDIMMQTYDATLLEAGFEPNSKRKQDYETLLSILLEKYQISSWYIWVGVSDGKIYKMDMQTNAPSLVGALSSLKNEYLSKLIEQSGDGATLHDSQRLSDMNDLRDSLDLFFKDFGGYPESNAGKPMYLDGNFGERVSGPTYIKSIPKAPMPAEGACTDFYNNYWYTPIGKPTNVKVGDSLIKTYPEYQYSFCLGSKTGSLSPGNYYLTNIGFKSLEDCPPSRQCYKTGDLSVIETSPKKELDEDEFFKNFIRQIPFTATYSFNIEVKSYNQERVIEEPKDSVDLEKGIKEIEKQLEGVSL